MISHVTVLDSVGYSLSVNRVCAGFFRIISLKFIRYSTLPCNLSGNMFIQLNYCSSETRNPVSLNTTQSDIRTMSCSTGRSLDIWMHQRIAHVMIRNVVVANGSAKSGGNINIWMTLFPENLNTVEVINSLIIEGSATHSGGVHVLLDDNVTDCYQPQYTNFSNSIAFRNTTFHLNHALHEYRSAGGGFSFFHDEPISFCHYQTSIVFNNCTFSNNYAKT